MSVQAGIWNLDGKPVNRDSLTRIGEDLSQFGPDSESMHIDGSLGMLYRAFHTTAESRLEIQPHRSVGGTMLTWDGRLDNREDILLQLRGSPGRDQPDVAIVATAFNAWGTDCFAKLVGDWALVIWSPLKRELVLARDYAGIRRLFYYPKADSLAWSNHLESLASCGDSFTVCDEYLAGYLSIWPDAHLTPYRELKAVPPGHFVRFHGATAITRSYWNFNPALKTRYKTDAEYEEQFRHLFRQSVRRRLRTDSPVLADLSGGLDSSAIVCMADDILAKEGAIAPRVDTFSAYDPNDPEEEDFTYFTKVEQQRGRIGHHAAVESGERTPSLCLKKSSFVAIPGFGTREEIKLIKGKVLKEGKYRVLLSGTGGDEMLGQATDPRVILADLLAHFRFLELRKQLVRWSLLLRRPWIHLFFDAVSFHLPTSIRSRISESAAVEPWFNKEFSRAQRLSVRHLDVAKGQWCWLPSTRDLFHNLSVNIRERACSEPAIEETRCPYLDRNLVEFLISLPTDQLLRPGERRSLMRRSLARYLPQEILSRRTKSTASRYLVVTLQNQWNTLEDILRSPFIARLGYVDQGQFYAAFVEAKKGILPPTFVRLLRALSCELWLQDACARGVLHTKAGDRCSSSGSREEFQVKTLC